ncbi:Type 1 glutamine amidotransferase-like domain-containing protein [Ornithinibacillus sp. 179-J 7C1 HS]|uniref:Type 1 glutamine amidotransferase-like domain-containing protein n=1 Tax=Ornithinibacillus sp. 179-J 7C1 HS TaxID=3142384 RepID=UPI0039A003FB
MDKHLFLFGGGSPFTERFAKKFVDLSSGGQVAILFLDGGEPIVHRYTDRLEELGQEDFSYIPMPSTSVENTINIINSCTGLIICGGESAKYAECIVDTKIADAVRDVFAKGIPIAGFSAGALISTEICVISARDGGWEHYLKRNGLGLLKDTLIAVHFSEWNEEEHLRKITSDMETIYNYGIDEQTGIYFKNDIIHAFDGGHVFTLEKGSLIQLH